MDDELVERLIGARRTLQDVRHTEGMTERYGILAGVSARACSSVSPFA